MLQIFPILTTLKDILSCKKYVSYFYHYKSPLQARAYMLCVKFAANMVDPCSLKDLVKMCVNFSLKLKNRVMALRLQLSSYEMTIYKNMFGFLMKDKIRDNSNAIWQSHTRFVRGCPHDHREAFANVQCQICFKNEEQRGCFLLLQDSFNPPFKSSFYYNAQGFWSTIFLSIQSTTTSFCSISSVLTIQLSSSLISSFQFTTSSFCYGNQH